MVKNGWRETIGRYLSYLVRDDFEEYAYDIVDHIAKARSPNELIEALYNGLRLSSKLQKKAEDMKRSVWIPSNQDINQLQEKLEEVKENEREVRRIGLSLALLSLSYWKGPVKERTSEEKKKQEKIASSKDKNEEEEKK